MELPEDCFLAYVVQHEAWYYEPNRAAGVSGGRSLNISASSRGGGVAWEFSVEEHPHNGGGVKISMFDDAFPALVQVPEFFAALNGDEVPESVTAVRAILDRIGAADTTERVNPRYVDRRAELAAKVEQAQTELDRYDVEHSHT